MTSKPLRCVLHNRLFQSMFSDAVEFREPHPVKGGLLLRDIQSKDIVQTDQHGLGLEVVQRSFLHSHLSHRVGKSRPRFRRRRVSMQ
jgi:hypothetical protein